MELCLPWKRILSRPNQSKIFLDSKANNSNEDTEREFLVSDPTEKDKSVAPSDTTDQNSNDKLECNVSNVATSEPKKNRKSKCGPNETHASKHAMKWSKRGALVDRGANGGALSNDAKVIFKRNTTVDIAGIDNHELNALLMVDATAKTIADKGPASSFCGTAQTMVLTAHCIRLDRLSGTKIKCTIPL